MMLWEIIWSVSGDGQMYISGDFALKKTGVMCFSFLKT